MMVKDIMSTKLILANPGQTVFEAIMLMVKNKISGLIVVEERKPVGIITMSDVYRRVVAKELDVKTAKVSQAMSSPVVSIHQLRRVENASELMTENKIKRLAVIENDEVIGIITAMDIVNHLPEMIDVMFKTWVKPKWRS